jgi:hypothetical protein
LLYRRNANSKNRAFSILTPSFKRNFGLASWRCSLHPESTAWFTEAHFCICFYFIFLFFGSLDFPHVHLRPVVLFPYYAMDRLISYVEAICVSGSHPRRRSAGVSSYCWLILEAVFYTVGLFVRATIIKLFPPATSFVEPPDINKELDAHTEWIMMAETHRAHTYAYVHTHTRIKPLHDDRLLPMDFSRVNG